MSENGIMHGSDIRPEPVSGEEQARLAAQSRCATDLTGSIVNAVRNAFARGEIKDGDCRLTLRLEGKEHAKTAQHFLDLTQNNGELPEARYRLERYVASDLTGENLENIHKPGVSIGGISVERRMPIGADRKDGGLSRDDKNSDGSPAQYFHADTQDAAVIEITLSENVINRMRTNANVSVASANGQSHVAAAVSV